MPTVIDPSTSPVRSTYRAQTGLAFPDVCKTPSPGGPVPIPYPNAAGYGQQNTAASKGAAKAPVVQAAGKLTMSSGDEAGSAMGLAGKQARAQQLRGQLHSLHAQLACLPGGNPTRWHQLVDGYVILTAELYKTLAD
jgi:hypothetical protein